MQPNARSLQLTSAVAEAMADKQARQGPQREAMILVKPFDFDPLCELCRS
jgi:hypothetical protein